MVAVAESKVGKTSVDVVDPGAMGFYPPNSGYKIGRIPPPFPLEV